MLLTIFAWIRFLIVIGILYAFSYEYLYKKYRPLLEQYDEFYWKGKPENKNKLAEIFNFTANSISGESFSASQKASQLFSHVGPFSEFKDRQYQQFKDKKLFIPKTLNQALNLIPINKKVDSYILDFYNWYRFEFTLTDLGHESYVEFRMTEQNKGSHQLMQKAAFKLPQKFYSQNPYDLQNQLNINFNTKGFSMKVSQHSTLAHYGDFQSDGVQHEKFFALSQNKTQITQLDFKKFGSAKTVTQINFTLIRGDYQIKANITHIIRQNQCLTNFQDNILKHKCMGGYAKGKINFFYFVRQDLNSQQKKYHGSWHRQTFNLDNTRVRTTFTGYRSMGNYLLSYLPQVDMVNKRYVPRYPQWNFKSIQMDFIGFDKLEYYAKKDKIQKQRWVGVSLFSLLQSNGEPSSDSIHQNYLFVNGNMHPIYEIQFQLPLTRSGLRNGNKIHFKNNAYENKLNKVTPSFDIQFNILNSTLTQQTGVFNKKQMLRVDGFWSGWIDEGTLFQDQQQRQHYKKTQQFGYVGFYNITGTIKIAQQMY